MALKPDRIELSTDISFFMETTGDRGGVASIVSGGTGSSMDDGDAVVGYYVAATGKPVGVLLNDVVDLDLTRQHINWYKDEVQKGGKVTLLRQGQVVTNMLVPAITPSAGDPAYVGPSGLIDTASTGDQIGQFLSAKDSDGYVKVSVNIV